MVVVDVATLLGLSCIVKRLRLGCFLLLPRRRILLYSRVSPCPLVSCQDEGQNTIFADIPGVKLTRYYLVNRKWEENQEHSI